MQSKDNVQEIYSLTPLQEGFLFHSLLDKDSSAYFMQSTYDLIGDIRQDLVEATLQELINRHDILRTSFVYEGLKKAFQVVLKEREPIVVFEDLRTLNEQDQQIRIETCCAADRERGFDLTTDVLMRLAIFQQSDNRFKLIWSRHHIILDGWCMAQLVEEFSQIYTAKYTQTPVTLPPVGQYRSLIKWYEKQNRAEARQFWQTYLKDYSESAKLPTTQRRNGTAPQMEEVTLSFSAEESKQIHAFTAENHVTITTFFQALWGVLLARYNDTRDVVFGSVCSIRPAQIADVEHIVGLFINTLPTRIRFAEQTTFQQLLRTVQEQQLLKDKYQYYSLAEIQSDSILKQNLINHLVTTDVTTSGVALETEKSTGKIINVVDITNSAQTNYSFGLIIVPGSCLTLKLNYDANSYNPAFIDRLAQHLQTLLEEALQLPQQPIDQLQLLSPQTQHQLYQDGLGQPAPAPSPSINHWLAHWAHHQPQHPALLTPTTQLSYHQLDQQVSALAHYLRQEMQLLPGQCVAVLLEREADWLTSILALWRVGAVYLPLNPDLPLARQRAMIEAGQAQLVLTQAERLLEALDLERPLLAIDLQREQWLTTPLNETSAPLADPADEQTDAYLIFTSGTSGLPKGVPISQAAISLRTRDHAQQLDLTPTDRVLQYANQSFDASLMEIGMGLTAGSTLVLVDEPTKHNTVQLAAFLTQHALSVAILPPATLQELLGEPAPNRLRLLITTGEKARLGASVGWLNRGVAVWNGYGPTEVCVGASLYPLRQELTSAYQQSGVPIGQPLAGLGVWVVDRQGRLLPQGLAGELVIGGLGLSRGYVSGGDASRFADVAGLGRVYWSGDVGYRAESGALMYVGRRDAQVQVRGIRVEPEGVEQVLSGLAGVAAVAVVGRGVGESSELVGYVVLEDGVGLSAVRRQAQGLLASYQVPSEWRVVAELPLTPNGKVDKKALAEQEASYVETKQTDAIQPRTATEQVLQKIWQEVLEKTDLGIRDNFFDVGGHSLKATQLVSRIYRQLNVQININEIFEHPTIEDIARLIDGAGTDPFALIPSLPELEFYPVSPAQKRLWVLNQLESGQSAYLINGFYHVTGVLNEIIFNQAFNVILNRHESLRTTFGLMAGEVQQFIQPYEFQPQAVAFIYSANHQSPEEYLNELAEENKPDAFDLAKGNLFRIRVVSFRSGDQLLTFSAHHIIFDGWSLQLLFNELSVAYNALLHEQKVALTPLRIQYKEYATWQLAQLSGESLAEQKEYWVDKFAEKVPVLALPTDFSRPAVRDARGQRLSFTIEKDMLDAIRQSCRSFEASPFMFLMAAVNTLLSRYAGQNDIVLGTPVTGRNHVDLENQLGFFLNVLPIRVRTNASASFATLLKNVRKELLDSFKYQQYPFDYLVEQLNLDRDTSRSPLFDVLVSHQRLNASAEENFDQVTFQRVSSSKTVASKYDLEWEFNEHDQAIYVNLVFAGSLFRTESMELMISHFLNLLKTVVADVNTVIDTISIADEAEITLLKQFSQGDVIDFGTTSQTVVQVFEKQAERTPDQVAVRCAGNSLTYAELNRRANQLAHYLSTTCGVGADAIVAYRSERSEWSLVAMLGIMKAGAAYLPIAPELPQERVAFLLADTQAKAVVCRTDKPTGLTNIPVIALDDSALTSFSTENHPMVSQLSNLAYVIYTSGSTGLPKGVLLEHAGLLNHLHTRIQAFNLDETSRVVQSASQSFDISMWQSLAALLVGGQTLVYPTDLVQQPSRFIEALKADKATVLQVVPTYLNELLSVWESSAITQELPHLQFVATIGEALKASVVARWYRRFATITLVNTYGPTEASDTIAQGVVNPDNVAQASIAIGRPIPNVRIYVLDKTGNLCPVNVKGELFVAGVCVGRGYLNNAEKTNKVFKTDPFLVGAHPRMYATGDVARWTADGNLEFFGRNDHQVKIRGHRIELGEVEQQLSRLPMVHEAAANVRYNHQQEPYLCGYLVLGDGVSADTTIIRQQLNQWLPPYLIPDQFFFLDTMPLTLSGKIDRNQLNMLNAPEPTTTAAFIAPTSPTEANLVQLYREILDVPTVSVTDNFFRLGGHSLKAIRLRSRIEATEQVSLTLKDIFNQPTISQLAELIDSVRWLNQAEQLPDEVSVLL